MKKFLLILISFVIFSDSFCFSVIKSPVTQANQVFVYVGNSNAKISLLEISEISIKDYQKISGKHFNFFERLNFKNAQKKLRKSIKVDGTIDNKILKNFSDGDGGGWFSDFNIGGFALGLFLFLPGILIAYLIGGDEDIRRSRVRWAWTGAGVFAAIALAILKSVSL